MRCKTTFLVLLMAAQMAQALDSVPKAEYRQRRVKLASELHGGSALIVAAHEPPMEYQDYRQDEDFFYLNRLQRAGRRAAAYRRWPCGHHAAGNGRPSPLLPGDPISTHAQSHPRKVHRRKRPTPPLLVLEKCWASAR